jgi:predicted nucleic acid-binding protein
MSEPVFVDASAWVAITNRTDRVHDEGLRVYHPVTDPFDNIHMNGL